MPPSRKPAAPVAPSRSTRPYSIPTPPAVQAASARLQAALASSPRQSHARSMPKASPMRLTETPPLLPPRLATRSSLPSSPRCHRTRRLLFAAQNNRPRSRIPLPVKPARSTPKPRTSSSPLSSARKRHPTGFPMTPKTPARVAPKGFSTPRTPARVMVAAHSPTPASKARSSVVRGTPRHPVTPLAASSPHFRLNPPPAPRQLLERQEQRALRNEQSALRLRRSAQKAQMATDDDEVNGSSLSAQPESPLTPVRPRSLVPEQKVGPFPKEWFE